MTKEEAEISRNRANEIEKWIKEEYPNIHVEHLRDCGTKLFYFKDPTSEYRCIGMIQIPISVIDDGVDPQTGHIHCTFAYKKVIFNAIDVEYDMEIFWKIFEHNKQIIKDYIEKSLKEQLVGIIKPQHPPYSINDAVNDLTKETQDEIDKEILAEIVKQLKKEKA
jgi:hypothetical protein